MNTTVKINTIIKSLENIDPASLHDLCDALVSAGALIPELKNKPIDPTGWSPSKHHTIPSPADSIIQLEEGLCVLEYSREEKWGNKLKRDVESIKQWAERESRQLSQFVFITPRDIGNEKINSEKFIKEELSQFNLQAFVFGQRQLLNVLTNSSYFHIRKEWLNIPEDYFQSLESFESRYIKQAKDRYIYLKKFVEDPLRQNSISALKDFTSRTDLRILLIHSQGGIGKTRFVLESLKRLKEETAVPSIDILFNQRKKVVNIDEVIPEISEEQESLIVLDDAHLIDNLPDFTNVLSQRHCTKVILITRSTAKESVKQAIDYPAEEMELSPLDDNESSIKLLKDNLEKPFRDEYLKYAARICEGNPLLIGLTAYLINHNKVQSLADLKTDDLIRGYFEKILHELDQVALDCYQSYLALLFLLKPFSINDIETRSLIRSLVNIDEVQEGHLLNDLEKCNVLEHHGDTLWLYPDLLGEYLVKITFFSEITILNFDDVFRHIPSSHMESVFTTLRELDKDKANLFLNRWANNLLNELEFQTNVKLFDNLELLKIIVPIVTDQALQIIDFLIKPENEKPPATSEDLWMPITREYPDILHQCLKILENPSVRYSNCEIALEKFFKIHFYKSESKEYVALRQAAFKAITKTAAYNLVLWEHGWEYSIQKQMLERVRGWKQESLEKNFTLILGVCEKLLEAQIKHEYSDSEGISWFSWTVVVTDDLVSLRQDVMSLLRSILDEIQETDQQIEVVRVLACATEHPVQMREDLHAMIQENTKTLLDFYLALANRIPLPEAEVLHEIEQQAVNLKTQHAEYVEVIDKLLSMLESHKNYQLYRTIMGDHSLFWKDGKKSYEQVQTERTAKIREIAHGITDENLTERLEQLNKIAEIASQNSDCDSSLFCLLLFEIGNEKPHIAKALIDKSLLEDNVLKRFAAEFIRGIRASTHSDIADNYVREWLSGKDQALILEIPNTYSGVDEKFLNAGDVELFDTLLHFRMRDKEQRRALDKHIMSNIKWVYNKRPARVIEIICLLFTRGDQDCIIDYTYQLWSARKQINLSQWDLQAYEKILQRLVDIPILNSNAINILAQYAQKAPFGLVRFFEHRVEKQKQIEYGDFFNYHTIPRRLNKIASEVFKKILQKLVNISILNCAPIDILARYSQKILLRLVSFLEHRVEKQKKAELVFFRAIPHRLDEIAEVYQEQRQYSEVINEIMRWFQKDDYHYEWAAADLISGISSQLDGPLKQILSNLARSGNEKNIKTVIEILKKFPEDSHSDDLYKEAVKHSEGKRHLQKHISLTIINRQPGASGIRGLIAVFQHLKEKLEAWLDDDNQDIRDFAHRTIKIVESRIKGEEKQAKEAEIQRRKGML